MAHQVDIWRHYEDSDSSYMPSDREYDEYTTMTVLKGDAKWGYGCDDKPVTLTLYVDPVTGLFVQDIAAYEKWITNG